MGEGGRKKGVGIKELNGEVDSPILPLGVQVVVDLPVGRGGRLLKTNTLIGREVQLSSSCPNRRHFPTNNNALIG